VNGSFWHQHSCHLFKWPGTRAEFWREKIARNVANDELAVRALQHAGWRVATVWECALKGRTKLDEDTSMQRLASWIRSDELTTVIQGSQAD
jgi:DNA mismatch endonuclease (patch repair protein)